LRKWKLLERIFKKLEDHELSLRDRKYLWRIATRVYVIGGINDAIDLSLVTKLFSVRPEILLARHLVAV
jgi:hypothetical protein